MKTALSFFSLFIGWCVAISALVCWQVFASGFGHVTDFNFFLFWPALFAFFGWLIFVLPAIYIVRGERPSMRFPVLMLTGAVYGVLVYLILVCTWLTEGWRLAWFPAIIGGVGGAVYSSLIRSRLVECRQGYRATALFLAPVVILSAFVFAVWPLVIRHLPYVAYVFGADESRGAAHLQILKCIRKGETFNELHRRYPRIFSEPMLGISGEDSRCRYRVSFDKTLTYVDEIEIFEKQ